MKTTERHRRNSQEAQELKMKRASNDFREMFEEIRPYITKSEMVIITTGGKWVETSNETEFSPAFNIPTSYQSISE